MSIVIVMLICLVLSLDAFSLALCHGTKIKNNIFYNSIKIGLIFGITEMTTPIIGWYLGELLSFIFSKIIMFLCFSILIFLGLRAIYFFYKSISDNTENILIEKTSFTFLKTLFFAVTTSIDSFGVGFSLSTYELGNSIYLLSFFIGLTTMFMSTVGILIGYFLKRRTGKYIDAISGVIFILLAFNIVT